MPLNQLRALAYLPLPEPKAPDAIPAQPPPPEPEPMPALTYALPTQEQVQSMGRLAIATLLASPEVATGLKALGYTSVGPTMPMNVLRGLVEALRAEQAKATAVASEDEVSPKQSPIDVLCEWFGCVGIKGLDHVKIGEGGLIVRWDCLVDNWRLTVCESTFDDIEHGLKPCLNVSLHRRYGSEYFKITYMNAKPDPNDFLQVAATLYAQALHKIGMTPRTLGFTIAPGSFAQEVQAAYENASTLPDFGADLPDEVPF